MPVPFTRAKLPTLESNQECLSGQSRAGLPVPLVGIGSNASPRGFEPRSAGPKPAGLPVSRRGTTCASSASNREPSGLQPDALPPELETQMSSAQRGFPPQSVGAEGHVGRRDQRGTDGNRTRSTTLARSHAARTSQSHGVAQTGLSTLHGIFPFGGRALRPAPWVYP